MALHTHPAYSGAATMVGDRQPPPSAPPALVPTTGEQAYVTRLLTTPLDDGIEAGLAVAVEKFRAVHKVLVDITAPDAQRPQGRDPHRCRQSPRWREAHAAYLGARALLAAVINAHHPDLSHGRPGGPIVATQALISDRAGPLCTGRVPTPGAPVSHHVQLPCPVHGQP